MIIIALRTLVVEPIWITVSWVIAVPSSALAIPRTKSNCSSSLMMESCAPTASLISTALLKSASIRFTAILEGVTEPKSNGARSQLVTGERIYCARDPGTTEGEVIRVCHVVHEQIDVEIPDRHARRGIHLHIVTR